MYANVVCVDREAELIMKRLKYLVLAALLLVGLKTMNHIQAKADSLDTATLRILATSDLHGQVTAYDYETNLPLSSNGLSKLATVIDKKRTEVGKANTLLLDNGDFLYDYSTNYFYDNYKNYVQPILKAMKIMEYDYITLGNHEFDYPWDYLRSQLADSKLADKVVVSNTVWHDNGELVFAPSAVVTRNLNTTGGATVPVRIGIVGSTTNSISTRRGDYVNEIDAQNNYESIVTEARRLKEVEKVDVVIVLIHGGIGSDKSKGPSDNIGYALTKVEDIDAVVTGHTHEVFPSVNNPDIKLANADNTTGLINGKPVVATLSHAKALGTIDLTFSIAPDNTVDIISGGSSIDYVSSTTPENSRITTMFRSYQELLHKGADKSSYPIATGVTYHNYDTVVRDSNLYQLFNNAKIAYGLTYISEYLPSYQGLPVIACTRNLLDSNTPSILIKGSFTASKVSQVLSEASSSRPSGYTQLYEISGKDLREWLEYNASIYATEGTNLKNMIQNYVSKNKSVSTLLDEKYIYNWNNQYVFDGISYQIDLTKKARYSSNGTIASSSNRRIINLTYNGVAVTDTQRFVLVSDSGLPSLSFLPTEMEDSIKTVKDNATSKQITLDYIKRLSTFGSIKVEADNNWSLKAGSGYTFLLGISKKIVGTVSTYPWNTGLAAETTSYSFLKGVLPKASPGINVIVSQGRTEVNNEPVPILISTTSKYSVKNIKYLPGKITSTTNSKWASASSAYSQRFTAAGNGTYTLLVTDTKGNKTLAYIKVDRYNANTLTSPRLDRLTNRNNVFTGKSVPNATIYATIGNNKYTCKASTNGTFKIEVIPPKAFTLITVYAESDGMKSAVVKAAIRKTGPDAVSINPVKAGDEHITGTTGPNTFVYALIWTTVYVGEGQTQVYKNSDFYNSKYKIVETTITVDKTTGTYDIKVPFTKLNMKVFVFAYDRFGVTSKSTMAMASY